MVALAGEHDASTTDEVGKVLTALTRSDPRRCGFAPTGYPTGVPLSVLRGSVSDLISVRAQLRRLLAEKRREPLTDAQRASLESAVADTERALATLAELANVRYPP